MNASKQQSIASWTRLDAASKLFEQHDAKLYLDQVIAKKLELQGVAPSDGSEGVTIVAPEPGETLPSGGGSEGDLRTRG